VYYNCTNGREFVSAAGLKKLGIETVPAIATRAVILDMVGLMGRDPVPEGTPFNRKEIDAALKRQGGMRINKGDVVIFYTGWTKLIGKDDKALRLGGAGSGHGIMILENVHAEEAVREKVSEGLFTLGPSRITGAVQAIINPIFVY
jgi:putative cyclase